VNQEDFEIGDVVEYISISATGRPGQHQRAQIRMKPAGALYALVIQFPQDGASKMFDEWNYSSMRKSYVLETCPRCRQRYQYDGFKATERHFITCIPIVDTNPT
jgi:hypothetical protein